ncbi:MAG TPA: ABC transporter permease [Vicinamibacterales bacterium]|nr:ABC transporter permease [Vicinamibacterales bacterium]
MAWTRFFRRNRRDDEAAREIASYIAIETDDNIARGMTPQAAHEAAVRKFGNATRVREEIYWMNTLRPIDTLWQDLKYAGRLLKRDKGFAAAAILSLALGIGANTAIFQLLDTVRLRSLPVAAPERLANISFAAGSIRSGRFSSRWPAFTYAHFEQLQAQRQVFSGMFAWSSGQVNAASGGEVNYLEALWASGDLFSVLGIKPAIGRLVGPEDDQRGCGAPIVVLSYAYWQRAFGGSPSVLQQTVRLEGTVFPIVGVTEPDFFGLDVGRRFDVAVPLCADPLLQKGRDRFESKREWWLAVVGRLAPGRTLQQANDQLIAISPSFMAATIPPGYSADDEKKYRAARLTALPSTAGVSDVREQFGEPLAVLLAATGLVLLIACANLANLLLARATARRKEIAVRLAIGASRRRIVSQLMVESIVIAMLGSVLAVGVARALTQVLIAQLAAGMGAIFLDLSWNATAFGFTACVATLACLLFGLAPAMQATSLAPSAALKAGGRGNSEARERFGLRRGLVVAQVALSLVLLVGALLFTRTLYNVLTIDAGFDQDLLSLQLSHPSFRVDDPDSNLLTRNEVQQRIVAVPGVADAALVSNVPLMNQWWNEFVFVDGKPDKALANFDIVSSNYFNVLGIPILKGRGFSAADTLTSPAVAIVNDTFVRKMFGEHDPIGRQLWVEPAAGTPLKKIEIVGVARDTKYSDIRDKFEPLVHLPASQDGSGGNISLLVKPRGRVDNLLPAISRSLAALNPGITIEAKVLTQAVRDRLIRERLMAALSAAFGALAGLLAAIGLYGVMSYTVTKRANEIGIRLAMGASRSGVLRLVIVEAAWLVGVGLLIGTAMGLGAAKAAGSLLFGLRPTDPLTMGAAIALLAAIGFIASYLPARRASRVDPMNVLRQE